MTDTLKNSSTSLVCANEAEVGLELDASPIVAPAELAVNDPIPAFPTALKALRAWCLWRYEQREGKNTKVPYCVNGRRAESDNPATWCSFEEACGAANEEFRLGICADGSHAFIDLDKCIVDGHVEPWAQSVLARCNSYAELSPSGSGLHIFVEGTVRKASRSHGCEIYPQKRFFTVTGQHLPSTPRTVNAMSPDALEELRQDIADDQLRPQEHKAPEPGRGVLIAERSMTPSEREAKLWRALAGDLSDYGNDRSAAVHGVLQMLARKHNGDRDEMQEAFEDSQLCNDWNDKWLRLCDAELDKAIARWQENGRPAWEPEGEWKLVRYSHIQSVPISWLWKGYLATGKLTMLNGEPSHGKSIVSLDIAARISKGLPWADGQANELPPSSVLVLTEEEDASDTIKPRFLAAGGDAEKLLSLKMGPDMFRVEDHTARLRKIIQEQAPDTKLIILDPVSDYTQVDAHKDAEVRPMLMKLVRLAGELDLAILGINHLNKKTDLSALHRVSGARAWLSVARLNFLVGRGADDTRHLVPLKNNVAKDGGSLDYTITSHVVRDRGLLITDIPKIEWLGKGTTGMDDLTAVKQPRTVDPTEEWLRDQLSDGEWHQASAVLADGEKLNVSEKKLQRTSQKIGVEKHQAGMPAKWEWRLPPSPEAAPEAPVRTL